MDPEIQELLDEHRNSVVAVLMLAAYLTASFLMFGDGLTPIVIAPSLFAAPFYWPTLAAIAWASGLAALAISIWSARFAISQGVSKIFLLPVIVFLWIVLSAVIAGAALELRKSNEFNKFDADRQHVESIFTAYHHTFFSDHFRYVHGFAIKDCRPYIWSYGLMSFEEIDPDTAVSILPREWVRECNINTEYDMVPNK